MTHVAASPDGQWLAWIDWPSGGLWRGRPDGSDRLKLTPPGLLAFLPRWSPDNSRLVFAGRAPEEATFSLYVTSAAGGEPELLAPPQLGSRHDIWDACWLPDGRTVVFSHLGLGGGGLFRVDVPSRRVSKWPGTDRLFFHKCSRQGAVLAFDRPTQGQTIFTAKVAWDEKGGWESLGLFFLGYPTWSTDGRSIIGMDGPSRKIVRFSLATRRFETVADLRDVRLAPTNGAQWMGLAADDSPLVLQDRSTSDIYALDWEAP